MVLDIHIPALDIQAVGEHVQSVLVLLKSLLGGHRFLVGAQGLQLIHLHYNAISLFRYPFLALTKSR